MYNSIFQKEWWLDAVAPGQWDAITIKKGGQIVARLPYITKKIIGITTLTQPLLTPALGPWLRTSEAKPSKQLSLQTELIWELLEMLPKHDLFSQSFHPSITNWLPFYWKGFEQTTRYTYVLENLSNKNIIWNGFSEQVRRNIRKAQGKVTIRTDLGIEQFLDLNRMTFSRQGKRPPYSAEFIERVDSVCKSQNARKIFFAEDSAGRIHAAIYILWDEEYAYYLMGGEDPELRNSEASSLLMWEAIQFASAFTKKFDFEGSMIQPIERFFRGFGPRQVPYFHITGMSRRMKLMQHSRSILRNLLN